MTRGGLFAKFFFVLFIFLIVLGVALGFLGYTLYQEVQRFQLSWTITEKAVLLKDGEAVLTGVAGTFKEGEMPHVLSEAERNELLQHPEKYQFVLIFKKEAFAFLSGELDYAQIKLSVVEARKILFSAHPKEEMSSLLGSIGSKPLPFLSDDELRGILFSLLVEQAVRQDAFFLLTQYRAGYVAILPEHALFKFFRYAPFYETLKKQLSSS